MTSSAPPPTTDSPWFWVLLFSLVALFAVVAISGQYGKRQARLERQYQARERIAEHAVDASTRREYSSPGATLVPIWPLAVPLGIVAVVAALMLRRECRRHDGGLSG